MIPAIHEPENPTAANGRTPTGPTAFRDLAKQLRLYFPRNEVVELRALEVNRGFGNPCVFAGWFETNDAGLQMLAKEALNITRKAMGVYTTLNPVPFDFLARRNNRIDKAKEGELSKDDDVVRRCLLLIDANPVRDRFVSATNEKKAAALEVIRNAREYLAQKTWPAGLLTDSGNGYHGIYRIDLPRDDGGKVERCLTALAHRFDNERAKIDQTVFNPSRICKLPGTMARKGVSIKTRPHRRAQIMEVPAGVTEYEQLVAVPHELLEALAAEAPVDAPPQPKNKSTFTNNGHSGNSQASRT